MDAKKKEPLLRVVKHAELSRAQSIGLRILAVALALVVGGVFIAAIGYNPFEIYGTIISGCFRSPMAFQATVKFCIPMCISALGVTLAFKMRFWNIGGEGQLIMGAVFASFFALFCSGMPHFLLLAVMFVAGFVGGGLWGLIPAACREKWGTNETLFTLMLNYIALYIVAFLRDGPWRDPEAAGFNKIARFDPNAMLDKVFGVHAGWIVMLVLVVILMVAAPFVNPSLVNLPSVKKAEKAPETIVEVIVHPTGALSVRNGKELLAVDMPGLIATVKKAQAGRADIPVVIAADKVVQYEQVVNVMKQLQAADIARVGLSLKVEK